MKNCPLLLAVAVLLCLAGFPVTALAATLPQALDGPGIVEVSSSGAEPWFGEEDPDHAQDGVDAARSGQIGHGQQSLMTATVTGPGTLRFWWRVSSERTYDNFWCRVADNPRPPISGESGWIEVTAPLTSGTHTVEWYWQKDATVSAGEDAAWVDGLRVDPPVPVPLAQALDLSSPRVFMYTGDPNPWLGFAGATPHHDGVDAARSGGLSFRSDLHMDVTGPGILSAWVRLSPQGVSARASLYLYAARRQVDWTGSDGWTRVQVEIPHGVHQVTWRWEDWGLPFNPEAAGYIDQLAFAPENPVSVAQALDTTGLTWTTDVSTPWAGLPAPMTNHDGLDAARSGTSGWSEPSGVQTTVDGPGGVTFWWRTDGPPGQGSSFLVDGVEMRRVRLNEYQWTGEWRSEMIMIPGAGPHTLRWEYSQPVSGGCVWLDEVVWVPGSYLTIPAGDAVGAPALFGAQPSPSWQGLQGPGLGRDGSAAKSENTSAVAATLRATVSGPGTISWWWRSDDTTPVSLILNGVTRHTEDLTRAWKRMELYVPGGSHTLDWRHYANGTAYVDEVIFAPAAPDSLPEAVESPALVWRSGGTGGPWFHQTAESYDGSDAARAPVTPDAGGAWIETDVTGPGLLRFAWKVSSEARAPWLPFTTGDQLSISVNTQPVSVAPIEGESGWVVQEVAINSAGLHKVRWTYTRNAAVTAGQDTAWLDAVTFSPAGPVSLAEAADTVELTWTTGGSGAWTGIGGVGDAQQGMDFAQSTPSAVPGVSWMETSLPDGGRVTYYCRYTGSPASLRVLVDGQVVTHATLSSHSTFWRSLDVNAPSGQPHTLRFECDNTTGGSWQVDMVSIEPGAVSLGEALDGLELTWTHSGAGAWTGLLSSTESHDGLDVARIRTVGVPLQVQWNGACAVSCWWRREPNSGGSFSSPAGQSHGSASSTNWEQFRAELPAPGAKSLLWSGGSGSGGSFWLDEVSITPLAAVPLAEALDGSGLTWTTNPSAPWAGWQMTSTSKDGADAAVGATAEAANPSWIEAQWSGAGAMVFQMRMGAPGLRTNILELSSDGGAAMPSNATNWQREIAIASTPGSHTLRWSVRTGLDDPVPAGGMLDEVAFHPALPLDEALDAPDLTWTTGGSGAWIGLSAEAAGAWSGDDAAISHVGPNQQTWLETTVAGPGMLSGRLQTASGLGSLGFSVDGVEQWNASNVFGWLQRTQAIPDGVHTLRWTHSRGAGSPELSVRAMLDAVTFTPSLPGDLAEAVDVPGLGLRTGGTGGWLNQDELAHDGMDALQSAFIGNGAESWIEFDVIGEQFLTFYLAAEALPVDPFQSYSAAVRFTLDGTRQFSDFVPAGGVWKKFTVRAPGAGAHTLRISLLPAAGDSTQFSLFVDELAMEALANVPLAEALEWPAFTTSATAPWQGFSAAAAGFDGVDFAAPGSLDFTGTAWLETTLTGPGRFRYRERVTPRWNYQAIGFVSYLWVNGANQTQTPVGDSVYMDLSPGVKTLRWEYRRTGSPGLRAPDWHLDQFSFAPGTTLAEALDRPGQTWTASSGWGGLLSAADSHDGVDVAGVEEIGADVSTTVQSSFSGPGVLSFLVRRGGPVPASLTMYVSERETPWTLEEAEPSGWERCALILSAGQQPVRWSFRKPAGTPAGSGGVFLDEVTVLPLSPVSLAGALDAESLDWITGPNAWEGFGGGDTDWAVSRDVAPGERSWVETSVNGPGFFSYRAGLAGDPVNPGTLKVWLPFVMSGDEEFTVLGSIGWAENRRVFITRNGPQRVRWTYRDRAADYGNTASSATLDAVVFTPAVPLAEALATPGLTWTTSPENPWMGVNDDYSWPAFPLHAVSGPSGDHLPSWIGTTITGPASLRFDWQISLSNATDGSLWVDGKLLHVLTESGTWRLVVPAGMHTVRWQRRSREPLVISGAHLANVALGPWPGDLVDMPDAPWLLGEAGWAFLTIGSHDGVDGLSLSGTGARLVGRIFGPGVFTSWQRESNGVWAQYTENLTQNEAIALRRFSGSSGVEWRHDEFVFQPAPLVALAEALDAPALTWTTGGTAPWQGFGAPIKATDGGDAAGAGIVGSSGESWLETSVTGPGRLTFLYTASASLTWSVDGVRFPLAQYGAANAEGFSSAAVELPAGHHAVRWTLRCPAGSEESPPISLDRVTFAGEIGSDDLARALDAPAYAWSTGGVPSWRGQTAVSHDVSDAAAAMRLPGQLLQTAVSGPGTVSFWWRRDTPTYDNPMLTFQVNSESILNATPNAGWERIERIVSGSGPQMLQWSLSATGNSYSGADHGWLDEFSFTPAPVVTLPEALDAPAFSWQTNPAAPWTGVAGAAFSGDGADAAAAGAPSPGNDSWLETQVEGPGTVSFLWRRTAGNAPLLCEIDGQLRGSATNIDFKPASFEFLTGGAHTIRWLLRRTADTDPAPAAAVDAFDFTPLPEEVTYNAFAAAALPEALRDPDADADGDGLTSLVEYAHGLDPASDDTARVPAPLGLPVIRLINAGGQQYCELQFPRRRNTSGLVQQAEFSIGPGGPWHTSPLAPVVLPVDEDWELVTIRDVLLASAPGRRFGRVRVTAQHPEY